MPYSATGPFAIEDVVDALRPGDKVRFQVGSQDRRKQPLEVVDTGSSKGSSWVTVEGPRGGDYDIAWSYHSRPFIPDMGDIMWIQVVNWDQPPWEGGVI